MIADESKEAEQSHQQQHSWRGNVEEMLDSQKYNSPASVRRRKLAEKLRTKYPKKSMDMKAVVLDDLLRHFNGDKGKKDKFHSVLKPKRHTNMQSYKLGAIRMSHDNKISELVTLRSGEELRVLAQNLMGVTEVRGSGPVPVFPGMQLTKLKVAADEIANLQKLQNPETLQSARGVIEKLENISIDTSDRIHNSEGIIHFEATNCRPFIRDPPEIVNITRGCSMEYHTNIINPQLNESLEKFLAELSRLQRNLYKRDNVKGRFRRRYYAGFKETERRFQLKKVKFVTVASDLDKNKNNGELDRILYRFIDSCRRHEITVIFGLSRRKLGYLMHGKGFVSCVGVANYEALEEKLEDTLKKALEAKNEFKKLKGEPEKVMDIQKVITDDLLLSERVKVLLKVLSLF